MALPGEASIARAGFAWESILDEAIFTIGPLLTTYVAFTYGLATPLWIAAVCVAVGTLLLSAARRTATSGCANTRWFALAHPEFFAPPVCDPSSCPGLDSVFCLAH